MGYAERSWGAVYPWSSCPPLTPPSHTPLPSSFCCSKQLMATAEDDASLVGLGGRVDEELGKVELARRRTERSVEHGMVDICSRILDVLSTEQRPDGGTSSKRRFGSELTWTRRGGRREGRERGSHTVGRVVGRGGR